MGNLISCLRKSSFEQETIALEEFEKTYEIKSTLGFGHFSEVKEAEHKFDKEKNRVAVKCISLAKMRDNLNLLKREIEIMKRLTHPNIVKLYEVFKDDEFIYITMELCTGGNLKEKVSLDGPRPANEVKKIAKNLLEALDYLHGFKICHRDLKPENIIFTADKVIKIADFGLARLIEGSSKYSMVGTPYYVSPEMITGDYNEKCDIWSLGILLYFSLTNRLPFYGEGYDDLFNRISMSEACWFGISDTDQDFIKFLMNKDYKLRPTAKQALSHPWLYSF